MLSILTTIKKHLKKLKNYNILFTFFIALQKTFSLPIKMEPGKEKTFKCHSSEMFSPLFCPSL